MSKAVSSKKALPITSTLEALFEFKVYKQRNIYRYELSGNSTHSNAQHYQNIMFREAFEDARHRLFNILGGSYKYNARLLNYVFHYHNREEYTQNYSKKYETKSIETYNQQIPETSRNYETLKGKAKAKSRTNWKKIKQEKKKNERRKTSTNKQQIQRRNQPIKPNNNTTKKKNNKTPRKNNRSQKQTNRCRNTTKRNQTKTQKRK